MPSPLKVAIVHEWLTSYAGSERVLEQILHLYPQADLYVLCDFLPPGDRDFLAGRQPTVSFIQRLPGAAKRYRSYLPLMPLAVEQLDVTGYDLVISSSHAVAKGVLIGPDQIHVSYVHSPMRYAWDLQHIYLREARLERGIKSWFARAVLHYLRIWDTRTANGVDAFLANSAYIGRRIRKCYGRDCTVVYPPVDVERFTFRDIKEDYYLTASRLVPYKCVPLVVEAFRQSGRRLIVVGDGPERAAVERLAQGASNIEYLGYQPTERLIELMGKARAFVFAGEEDFGIAPVEAQACGTPVIAYGSGGVLESVVDGTTGLFFETQTTAAIQRALERFEAAPPMSAQACRANAERFSISNFHRSFLQAVQEALGKAGRV